MAEVQIILASASPRRSELLRGVGVPFEVVTAKVRELAGTDAPDLSPVELARENARRKAAAVAALQPGRWVLGADTLVAVEKVILGKPDSLEQARVYLRMLSGRAHEVITGCALLAPTGDAEIFHASSRVTFHVLSDETIERYLAEVDVLDKAGAYALQERGEWIVAGVEGSRANVIGLPVEALTSYLQKRGLL